MSYLLDFVKTFDESELSLFRQLNLVGKEQLIRDEYANHANDKKFDETQLPTKYNLSPSHFDKINSVLLDKSIHGLYASDFDKLFGILLQKGLSTLLLHELKIVERKVMKQKIVLLQTDFYKAAFYNLCRMFHPNYNSKITTSYGKKYLQLLGNKATLREKATVGLFILQADLLAQYMSGNEVIYQPIAQKKLSYWNKLLKNTNDPTTKFHLYNTQASYIKYYDTTVPPFLAIYEKALVVLNNSPQQLSDKYRWRVLCELGFGNMEMGNAAKAQTYYQDAFLLENSGAKQNPYQAGNYLFVCLINSDFKKAKEISDTFLTPFLNNGVNRSLQFDVMVNRCIMHLHLKEFKSAFDYLSQIRAYRKNEITRYGQVMLRCCETLYFYSNKEYSTAQSLAKKNLKFLSRPENTNPQFEYFRTLTDCVIKIIKRKQGLLQSTQKLDKQLNELPKNLYQIFNKLL